LKEGEAGVALSELTSMGSAARPTSTGKRSTAGWASRSWSGWRGSRLRTRRTLAPI